MAVNYDTASGLFTAYCRKGCEWFVWRYRPDQLELALRAVTRLAGVMAVCDDGEPRFTWHDAAILTQGMRQAMDVQEETTEGRGRAL